eukprot:5335344-Amphidinium_carterae.1
MKSFEQDASFTTAIFGGRGSCFWLVYTCDLEVQRTALSVVWCNVCGRHTWNIDLMWLPQEVRLTTAQVLPELADLPMQRRSRDIEEFLWAGYQYLLHPVKLRDRLLYGYSVTSQVSMVFELVSVSVARLGQTQAVAKFLERAFPEGVDTKLPFNFGIPMFVTVRSFIQWCNQDA